jgi:hypothetical protein
MSTHSERSRSSKLASSLRLLCAALALGALVPGAALAHPINRAPAFGSFRLDTTSSVPPGQADTCVQDSYGALWNNNCAGSPPTVDMFARLQIQTSGLKTVYILPIGGTWSSYIPTCTVYSDFDGTTGTLVTGTSATLSSGTPTTVSITVPAVQDLYLICDGIGPSEGIAYISWTD